MLQCFGKIVYDDTRRGDALRRCVRIAISSAAIGMATHRVCIASCAQDEYMI